MAADLAGNVDTATVVFTLDRDPPTIAGADTSTVLQTNVLPITVRGTAADFDRVVAVTSSVDNGTTYVPVDSMSASGPVVSWSTSVTFPGGPGRHPLRIRAQDAVGHVAENVHRGYDDTSRCRSRDRVGYGKSRTATR